MATIPRGLGFVERFGHRVDRQVARVGERAQLELAPQYRGQREDVIATFRQRTQAAADHLPDALRDLHAPRRHFVDAIEATVGLQQADDLRDEEWVAFSLAKHRLDQRGGGVRPAVSSMKRATSPSPRPRNSTRSL